MFRVERSAVSGKTTYLVAGFEMEDGRPITEGSKYKKAMELGVKIINEDDVIRMVRESDPAASMKYEEEQKKKQVEEEKAHLERVKKQEEEMLASFSKTSPSSSSSGNQSTIKNERTNRVTTLDMTLLTSKYAPRSKEDIIGNRRIIDLFQSWLQQWDDVHIHSKLSMLLRMHGIIVIPLSNHSFSLLCFPFRFILRNSKNRIQQAKPWFSCSSH